MRPIALSEHRWLRLVVLCALYVAQGVPFGFLTVTLAAAMAASGAETKAIASVFALGTIPWAFKWVWGPFVDRFGNARWGRRRPWILVAQAGMIGTLVAMAMMPDPVADLQTLGLLVVLHNIFNSLQDVCVDAMAIDLLPPEDRGKASGLMYGAKYGGTAIGGGGLSVLAEFCGMPNAYLGMIAVIGAIALLPLLTIERPGDLLLPWSRPDSDHEMNLESSAIPGKQPGRSRIPAGTRPRSILTLLRDLANAFTMRAAIVTALVALLATAASGLLSPIATNLFVGELGWSQAEYGAATGGAAVLAGLAGAVLGGFLADLIGPRRIFAICSLTLAILLGVFGLGEGFWGNRTFVWFYLILESALAGCLNAAFFAICFGVCRPSVAATQFTAYMALMNLGVSGIYMLSGPLEESIGIQGTYLTGALIQLSVVLLVPFTMITRRKNGF
jgi:PAT family beta-lactamase induction signal transducer AmpG